MRTSDQQATKDEEYIIVITGLNDKNAAVRCIEAGAFDDELSQLKTLGEDELKKIYTEREMEPAMSDEGWKPAASVGLA